MAGAMTITPLKTLNIAARMGELSALYGQAMRYERMGKPTLPGIPDIPKMIMQYLKALAKELLEKLRPRVIELLTMIMMKAVYEIIPPLNKVIEFMNKVIDMINDTIDFLFPVAKRFFQVIVVLSILYIVPKIIVEVMLDFGAGMGAVTVFTTKIMRKLMWISNTAQNWLAKLKPIAFAILAVMRMLLSAFSFLQILASIIEFLKMFQLSQQHAAESDASNTPSIWNDLTLDTGATEEMAGLVECHLDDGLGGEYVEWLTPEECLERGGWFPGMDLLSNLNDIDQQIAALTSDDLLDGDQIVDCQMPDGTIQQMSLNACIAAGGTPINDLASLLAERDNLLGQLEDLGLDYYSFDEDIINSLLNPDPSVTVQDATEREGIRYGFYGAQSTQKTIKNNNNNNTGEN